MPFLISWKKIILKVFLSPHLHAVIFVLGRFFFFGTKNRQMVTQFFEMEYSVANSLFFEKK